MLNFGASKPRVRGGLGPKGPPGSAPGSSDSIRCDAKQHIQAQVSAAVTEALRGRSSPHRRHPHSPEQGETM